MSLDPQSARWYAAWKARDLDAIMALYGDDLEFSSPFVAALGFSPDGVITLKPMLRAYFEMALSRVKNLDMEPIAVCQGCHGLTLVYRIPSGVMVTESHSGVMVTESHEFDEQGRIMRAHVSYEITG
jgi:hypothetical protein